MKQRIVGLFAGRGIHLPSAKVTTLTILGAFLAGVLIAWVTTLLPGWINSMGLPSVDPSVTASPEFTSDPNVSIPPLAPIFRDLDDDDRRAGITTLEYEYVGAGTFTLVPGSTEPDPNGPPIRWVSIEVEDGLGMDPAVLSEFVMEALNDPRGWGAHGRLQFARTDGVADTHLVFASPYTAAALCPSPHATAPAAAIDAPAIPLDPEASPEAEVELQAADAEVSPTASASPSAEPGGMTCADRSVAMISVFDWKAGLEFYESERNESRIYQVIHYTGHLMGEDDVPCTSGVANVMVDQWALPEGCTVNPWPYPDALPEATPEPTPDP